MKFPVMPECPRITKKKNLQGYQQQITENIIINVRYEKRGC